ncbi:HK97 family phage prohead protease [Nocardiopsis sp. LOL_012]|uniref:HK97 family phage prohead protease n=1 Tax=Nocardiopsis sp. LOL_012 TaxID=3345409 RepID=UPI003A87E939
MMRTKSVPVRIKAAGEHEGTEDGVFEAIVAAYNVDSVGDKISPGAFTKTIAEWTVKGDPIPVIWSHNWVDPDSHIGVVEDIEETDDGLWVKARLDLDEPRAAKVYRLLKGRRVTQFSFGYEVPPGGGEWVDGKSDDEPGHYALNEIKLFEVGPCLVGANQHTSLGTVKTGPGLTETRVREIVWEALAGKDSTPEPQPAPAAADTLRPAPDWEATNTAITALTDQVKQLTDQLAQQPTPVPAAVDDDLEGKSAPAPASDPLRAQLAGLTAHLAAL